MLNCTDADDAEYVMLTPDILFITYKASNPVEATGFSVMTGSVLPEKPNVALWAVNAHSANPRFRMAYLMVFIKSLFDE